MRIIEAVEVEDQFDDLLDAVGKGETLLIRRNGKVVARMLTVMAEQAPMPTEMSKDGKTLHSDHGAQNRNTK